MHARVYYLNVQWIKVSTQCTHTLERDPACLDRAWRVKVKKVYKPRLLVDFFFDCGFGCFIFCAIASVLKLHVKFCSHVHLYTYMYYCTCIYMYKRRFIFFSPSLPPSLLQCTVRMWGGQWVLSLLWSLCPPPAPSPSPLPSSPPLPLQLWLTPAEPALGPSLPPTHTPVSECIDTFSSSHAHPSQWMYRHLLFLPRTPQSVNV